MLKRNRILLAVIAASFIHACGDNNTLQITGNGDADTSGSETLGQLPDGSHTPHTGPADGVWPPQPKGMVNVEPFPASARAGVLTGVLDAARGSIMNNPRVRENLGSDYREIEAFLADEKSGDVARLVFYNYTTDETISASLDNNGAVNAEIFPASTYQPTEHPEEVLDAIALAQTALTDSSFDVSGLTPTAMLAFPAARDVESVDRHFYAQRVLYVTFGPGGGSLPVYTALVDLSRAAVVEHGLVK